MTIGFKLTKCIPPAFAAGLLLLGCLVGCSGGGDGGGDDSGGSATPSVLSGQFLDAPVEGLYYATSSQKGYTDRDGAFRYQSGESIRFFVGGIYLGEATAEPSMTPMELVAGANTVYHPSVINMARFLQTLDEDGNPENGIFISARVREACASRPMNFLQTPQAFESDVNVTGLLDTLNALGLFPGQTRTLRSEALAVDHLLRTLGGTGANDPDPGDDSGDTGGDSDGGSGGGDSDAGGGTGSGGSGGG